jgi:hypothetical protein
MIELSPLLADVGDVIGTLIGVIFVIVAVAGQIFAKVKEGKPAARKPRPARPPQGPAARQPVEDEIRQFLRGAAKDRPAGGQRPQQVAPPRGGRPMPQRINRPARPAVAPVEAEIVAAEPVGLREQLEAKKSRTLGSSLQKKKSRADDKMAGHVREVFEHRLGSLEGTPGAAGLSPGVAELESPQDQITPLPSSAAAGLAAVFSSADTVRQAILIHEVLERPEHRWQ